MDFAVWGWIATVGSFHFYQVKPAVVVFNRENVHTYKIACFYIFLLG
jgi:hypothetical protein